MLSIFLFFIYLYHVLRLKSFQQLNAEFIWKMLEGSLRLEVPVFLIFPSYCYLSAKFHL